MNSDQRPPSTDASGFVLAGGQSSRMGTDKALLLLNRQPLIALTLDILSRAGLTASIAGARTRLADFASVVEDGGAGPLDGICAALRQTSEKLAVFLPVDLPLIPPALLQLMVCHAQITRVPVTLARVNGFVETFPAVIDKRLLPLLENELRKGNGGCFAAFRSATSKTGRPLSILPVEYLVQAGQVKPHHGLPPSFWFLNINRPTDLARAESAMAAANRRVS